MAEERANKAQLGCGTLILIAIIVMIFSGRSDTGDVEREVSRLRAQVESLEGKIDALTEAVESLSGPGASDEPDAQSR